MGSAAIGILALSGIAAVAAMVAFAFGRHVVSALDSAFSKWWRMGFVVRIVTAAMVVVATVEAQKKCSNVGMSECSNVNDSLSTFKHSNIQTFKHYFSLKQVITNDSYSYSMPATAVRYPNWWMRGGYEDVFKLELGDWRFPIGTNLVDYLWVYIWGRVRPRLKAKELEIAAVGSSMSAVPQVSEFWYADGTNGSKILTWHNFFVGRIPLSELNGSESDFSRKGRKECVEGEIEENVANPQIGTDLHESICGDKCGFVDCNNGALRTTRPTNEILHVSTRSRMLAPPSGSALPNLPSEAKLLRRISRLNNSVVPISAQLELFPNGDYIARSNNVERYFKRVNPDDWDDDGIPNDIDANPEGSDGDFFGPDNDLPEGANSSNYCWVEVAVSNANSLVTFTGDKPSNLPDPYFVAKAGESYAVNLLIGKTYRVTSSQPITCTAKSSDDIIIDQEDARSMTIVYPVSYEIVDNARSVSRQVRLTPPLVGMYTWNTNTCCETEKEDGPYLPSCAPDCACEGGCDTGGFTFSYEGYSLDFGGVECGCRMIEPEEDEGPYAASASVSFSEKAIIFEDAYENKPGELVPKKSNRSVLSCVAHGGPSGGRAVFTLANAEKLVRVSGVELPFEVDVPAGHKVAFDIVYEGGEASGSENDVVATAQFIDNEEGDLGGEEDELTVVEVELEAAEDAPENPCQNRHIFGVSEAVNYRLYPASVSSDMQMDIEDAVFWVESKRFYCPWIGGRYDIEYNYKGAKFESIITVYNPIVICKEVQWDGIEGTVGSAGQVGMKLWLGVGPSTVSFDGIFMVEIPDDVIRAHEGYFCSPDFNRTGYLSHSADAGAGKWLQVHGGDWCVDEARRQRVYPEPWSEGWKEWNIPVGWGDGFKNLKGEISPMPTKQRFTIGVDGSASVEKYGNKIERHVNNKVYLNGVLQN